MIPPGALKRPVVREAARLPTDEGPAMPYNPDGARKADAVTCRKRVAQIEEWLAEGRTGPWIVQAAMAKWGHTRRSVQRYLRKARVRAELLLPPICTPGDCRCDGRSYAPRVDAATFQQRLDQIHRWLADGHPGQAIIAAVMRHWGVQKPQATRYLQRAWKQLEEPRGKRREQLCGRARERWGKVVHHGMTLLKTGRIRRKEVEIHLPKGEGEPGYAIETVRDNGVPAPLWQMLIQAGTLLDRVDGLDEPIKSRETGRPSGLRETPRADALGVFLFGPISATLRPRPRAECQAAAMIGLIDFSSACSAGASAHRTRPQGSHQRRRAE